jgi:hypothetical protein
MLAVAVTVAVEDVVGTDGGTAGAGAFAAAAGELDDAVDLLGGMVASALSARSRTAAAVSPPVVGGEAAGDALATSLDWRDAFARTLWPLVATPAEG